MGQRHIRTSYRRDDDVLKPMANSTSIKLALGALALLVSATSAAHAQQGESLREAAQNPIGDLISLPFQNNTNFDIGRTDNTQNVLNIQPVYPLHLNPTWNLISRPILPVIYQPPFLSGRELAAAEEIFGPAIGDTEFGLGDLTTEFFFSPRKPIQLGPHASLIWGIGPVFQFPTATDELLGTEKWSVGPDFVVFLSNSALHITTSFLILNVWSFAGDENRADVNAMTLQPFLNHNLPKGWYLTTALSSPPSGRLITITAGPCPLVAASGASLRSGINRSMPTSPPTTMW